MRLLLNKPDLYGALASTLCLVHCIATPLILISYSYITKEYSAALTWWENLDYLFLIIAFVAVFRSIQTTTKNVMRLLLCISWILLFAMIINEKFELFQLPEYLTYTSAIMLTGLHLYNYKYCQYKIYNFQTKK